MPTGRVRFLGDSTTLGLTHAPDSETSMGGYRGTYLTRAWAVYRAAGGSNNPYPVGTQTSAVATWGLHEGHGGARINDITDNVATWLPPQPADATLLWIGINDFIQGLAVATAFSRLEALVAAILLVEPPARVFVGTLITPDSSQGWPANAATWVPAFNALIRARWPDAAAVSSRGEQVTYVDIGPLVPFSQLFDGLHPSATGYATVGNGWFDLGGDFMASRSRMAHRVQDQYGNFRNGIEVTVYETDGTTELAQTMYSARSGGTALGNPLVSDDDGLIEAFVATPQSVIVGYLGATLDSEFRPAAEDILSVTLGTKGHVMLAGASAPEYGTLRRKNLLTNGDARVKTRTAMGTTDNSKCFDNMRLLMESASGWTISQETSDLPVGSSTAAFKFTVGSTNNVKGGGFFPIPFSDICRHRGKTVSIQGKFKISNARIGDVRMALAAFTGTADSGVSTDPISAWGTAGTNPTLATNWSFVNTPTNLGVTTSYLTYKVEALTVSTSATNLALIVWCDDQTTTAADYFLATDLSVEPGDICTDYEDIPLYLQEMACAYRIRGYGGTAGMAIAPGINLNTGTIAEFSFPFQPVMAGPGIPTLEVTASDWVVQPSSGPIVCTAIATFGGNRTGVKLRGTVASGLSDHEDSLLQVHSSTTGTLLIFTNEL